MGQNRRILNIAHTARNVFLPLGIVFGLFAKLTYANSVFAPSLEIISELGAIKAMLSQIGPTLSAVLFIVAGIFYAVGQILPPEKKANFHTTAVNIVIGAIVVGVMSVAATSLATASSGLLSNFTATNNSTA